MSELSLTHCKYEYKYHVVFAPKFRRQVIYGKIKSEIGKILRKLHSAILSIVFRRCLHFRGGKEGIRKSFFIV